MVAVSLVFIGFAIVLACFPCFVYDFGLGLSLFCLWCWRVFIVLSMVFGWCFHCVVPGLGVLFMVLLMALASFSWFCL